MTQGRVGTVDCSTCSREKNAAGPRLVWSWGSEIAYFLALQGEKEVLRMLLGRCIMTSINKRTDFIAAGKITGVGSSWKHLTYALCDLKGTGQIIGVRESVSSGLNFCRSVWSFQPFFHLGISTWTPGVAPRKLYFRLWRERGEQSLDIFPTAIIEEAPFVEKMCVGEFLKIRCRFKGCRLYTPQQGLKLCLPC